MDGLGGAYLSTFDALEGSGAVLDRKFGEVARARPVCLESEMCSVE